jgi:hypothetical protein
MNSIHTKSVILFHCAIIKIIDRDKVWHMSKTKVVI